MANRKVIGSNYEDSQEQFTGATNSINDALGEKPDENIEQSVQNSLYVGTDNKNSIDSNLGPSPEVNPIGSDNNSATEMTGFVPGTVVGPTTPKSNNEDITADFSWNTDATAKAETTYKTDTESVKQNYLTNRQTLEQNAVNYQAQADMMKYQNNQNAEKVGWTGGYVLDQNRQMEYLKASIQAQMYGAMELQKYGYDSALAAARLSYDLNQQEYAHQYYQEAVQNALNEAQITGTYFSAETKDMMNQLRVAELKANDSSLSENERTRATKLIETINNWFEENGVSKAGTTTLQKWQAEQSNSLEWAQYNWNVYNAALESAKTDIQNNATAFIRYTLDENGNPKIDYTDGYDGEVRTIDMNNMTAEQLIGYVIQNNSVNSKAKEQVQSYLDYLYNDALAKVTTTDSNGKQTINTSSSTYKNAIEKINTLVEDLNKKLESNPFSNPVPAEENTPSNTWTPEATIKLQGDGEAKELKLTSLNYSEWNDPNNKINDAAGTINKAEITIKESDLPKGWKEAFEKAGITTPITIKTLPFIFKMDSNNNSAVTGMVLNGNTQTSVFDPKLWTEGLGGLIESSLSEFYSNTSGQNTQIGSCILINNTLYTYIGESSPSKGRWIPYNIKDDDMKNYILAL